MANLSQLEKTKLEDLLGMGSGYVLDFSDTSFSSFFASHSINIDDPKYSQGKLSTSKANRLRGFWEQEDDKIVGQILKELIETVEYRLSVMTRGEGGTSHSVSVIAECKDISKRLLGVDVSIKGVNEKQQFLVASYS